jgi:RNA polymerase sigma-70 factor (ECF subfamily)
MDPEQELIDKCLANDPFAQELLYRRYASKMYGICLRYVRQKEDAGDILQDGFVRVFMNLKHYRGDGSFEGWIRRIIVNTAINHYKANVKFSRDLSIDDVRPGNHIDNDALSRISTEELLKVIRELPDGFRMVFNLFVIEGYDHKEIGQMLGISESTSKSQLHRAKAALQKKLLKEYNILCYERTA